MKLDELKELIAGGESDRLEFKETTGQRGEACRTLCAFLNGDGGTVIFGVSRKGKLTGQLISDKTKRELFEVFSRFDPAADIETEWVDVDATHQAIVCTVGRGNGRPYAYDGRAYKRVQSSTTMMTQEEYRRMLDDRRGFQSDWELAVNSALKVEGLDIGEVQKTARMAIDAGRLPPSTNVNDVEGLLDGFKVRSDGKLKNAAVVLFCKEDTDYAQCLLRLARFKGGDKGFFIDNKQVTGNVFHLIDLGMAFCFNHLSLSGRIDGVYREEQLEVPPAAIREALVNALAHRSYEKRGGSVSLAIYDDRIEIINPGALPFGVSMEKLESGNVSEPRNPTIARVMFRRKTLESWGRGIKLIVDECLKVGLPKPKIVVEDGGYVKVTLARPQVQQMAPVSRRSVPDGKQVAPIEVRSVPDNGQLALMGEKVRTVKTLVDSKLPHLRSDAKANAELVLVEIFQDKQITIPTISENTNLPIRTVKNAIEQLKGATLLSREGSDRSGYWVVKAGK